jgi:hypothetical protein
MHIVGIQRVNKTGILHYNVFFLSGWLGGVSRSIRAAPVLAPDATARHAGDGSAA